MSSFSKYNLIIFLFTHLILLSAVSCADRGGLVSSDLVSADSLMMTAPQAALDILSSIDSIRIEEMGRRERAFYTLLRTEAEYKCYLPVAEDTAIYEAVEYYRSRGPEDRLARALSMKGAVLSERNQPVAALKTYKMAEPLIESTGDYEQLGLLYTKIATLYQYTVVNNKEAENNYRNALKCFRTCGKIDRIMRTHLSLARVLVSQSVDSSYSHIEQGMKLAEESGDTSSILLGYELMTHICLRLQDYAGVIRISSKALKTTECMVEAEGISRTTPTMNIILFNRALSYAYLGDIDSSLFTSSLLVWTDSDEDKMRRHWLASAMAESRGDWRTALKENKITEAITDNIEKEGVTLQLAHKEFIFTQDYNEKEHENYVLRVRISAICLICLFLLILSILIVIYYRNKVLCAENENLRLSIISCGISEKEELERHICCLSPENEELQSEVRSIVADMLALIKELNEMCYREDSGTGSTDIRDIVNRYFPKNEVYLRIRKVCDILYPSKLSEIESNVPSLTNTDKLLIALMGCGFPTGAICAVMRLTKESLNVQKTRTARKIGPKVRLSNYVTENFSKNIS